MFSLESPHRGDSNEYTQHTVINMRKKITQNYLKYNYVCSYVIFLARDSRTSLETAVVNMPSVFEPLRFYCINKPDNQDLLSIHPVYNLKASKCLKGYLELSAPSVSSRSDLVQSAINLSRIFSFFSKSATSII